MIESLIWTVPLAVAAFGAWRPKAGLVALTAALPLFGTPPGGPYLGALEASGLAAIVTAWRAGRPERSALTPAVTAFLAISLLSLAPSPYTPPSWRPGVLLDLVAAFPGVANWQALYTWRAAADLLLGCGLFFAVRRAFAGSSVQPLARALYWGLGVTLLFGLAAFGGLLSLDAYRPSPALRASYRLQSFFFLSGWLAEYIVVAAPFALAAVFAGGGRRKVRAVALLGLSFAGLALTLQRGAWVAAAVEIGLLVFVTRALWLRDRGLARRVAVATGLVLIVGLATIVGGGWLDTVVERASSISSGVSSRASLWSTAVEMVRQRPVGGWGLGSFTPAYDLLNPPGSEGARLYRGTAHSLYLHVAAERGLLGLLALGLLGWATLSCFRLAREKGGPHALGLGLGLAGVAAYGLVQYMFHLRNISWLFWILLGCLATIAGPARLPRLERLSKALLVVALVLLPIRLIFTEAPPLAGDRTFGLHELEGAPGEPFRWTEAVAVERLPWAGETLVLGFANGHPAGGSRPVTVTVGIDGERVASFEVAGGWEEHRIEVGAPNADSLVLTIEARPSFRPFSDFRRRSELAPRARRSTDIRRLGVARREARWLSTRPESP